MTLKVEFYEGKFSPIRVKFVIKATPTTMIQAAGNCSCDGATTQITSSLGMRRGHRLHHHYIITMGIISYYWSYRLDGLVKVPSHLSRFVVDLV